MDCIYIGSYTGTDNLKGSSYSVNHIMFAAGCMTIDTCMSKHMHICFLGSTMHVYKRFACMQLFAYLPASKKYACIMITLELCDTTLIKFVYHDTIFLVSQYIL